MRRVSASAHHHCDFPSSCRTRMDLSVLSHSTTHPCRPHSFACLLENTHLRASIARRASSAGLTLTVIGSKQSAKLSAQQRQRQAIGGTRERQTPRTESSFDRAIGEQNGSCTPSNSNISHTLEMALLLQERHFHAREIPWTVLRTVASRLLQGVEERQLLQHVRRIATAAADGVTHGGLCLTNTETTKESCRGAQDPQHGRRCTATRPPWSAESVAAHHGQGRKVKKDQTSTTPNTTTPALQVVD